MLSEDIIRSDGTVGPLGQRFEDALPPEGITDVLVFGVDIDIASQGNSVPDPDPNVDGTAPARIYIQGGRAYCTGVVVMGGGYDITQSIPEKYAPWIPKLEGQFGDQRGVISTSPGVAVYASVFASGDPLMVTIFVRAIGGSTPLDADTFVNLSGLSWPLLSAAPT